MFDVEKPERLRNLRYRTPESCRTLLDSWDARTFQDPGLGRSLAEPVSRVEKQIASEQRTLRTPPPVRSPGARRCACPTVPWAMHCHLGSISICQ